MVSYANVIFHTDFSKWDGHNAEELRAKIIRDLYEYLRSGECPDNCKPEYLKTLRKFQTESNSLKLKGLIQHYYFEFLDSMQFWNADIKKETGNQFPIYKEVLGLYE